MQELMSLEDAFTVVDRHFQGMAGSSSISMVKVLDSVGRITGRDIYSPVDVPGFHRSTMDGYAVRARDTFGAGDVAPVPLRLVGQVRMGEDVSRHLGDDEVMYVPTGGMIPPGADAVVMIEDVDRLGDDLISVRKSVSPGENVVQPDEDIAAGAKLITRGREIGPAQAGVLAAAGITEVPVYEPPVIGLLSTGDEIIPVESKQNRRGQVRDINSYTLASFGRRSGADTRLFGIVRDEYEQLRDAVEACSRECDMVVISGGSSVGTRDYTVNVIAELGQVLIHGVAVKPGKPTIIGSIGDRPTFGLPGHPVSAIVIYALFVNRCVAHWYGTSNTYLHGPCRGYGMVTARLSREIMSAVGREEYVRVRLEMTDDGMIAVPVVAKSGVIRSLAGADGLVRVPAHKAGVQRGTPVEVIRL